MSSTKGIPIYRVIIFPHPFTFVPTRNWSRYLPNLTYMVAPTFLVVFPTNLATTENNDEKKQNVTIARNLKLYKLRNI